MATLPDAASGSLAAGPGMPGWPCRVLPSSLPSRLLRIGRSADNDIVVADLGVSRYHAELRRTRRGYEIADLDSHNGTFLNGQQINVAPVRDGDLIGVGPATFRMVGGELEEFLDTGDISLAARDLTVRLPDQPATGAIVLTLLDPPYFGPDGARLTEQVAG